MSCRVVSVVLLLTIFGWLVPPRSPSTARCTWHHANTVLNGHYADIVLVHSDRCTSDHLAMGAFDHHSVELRNAEDDDDVYCHLRNHSEHVQFTTGSRTTTVALCESVGGQTHEGKLHTGTRLAPSVPTGGVVTSERRSLGQQQWWHGSVSFCLGFGAALGAELCAAAGDGAYFVAMGCPGTGVYIDASVGGWSIDTENLPQNVFCSSAAMLVESIWCWPRDGYSSAGSNNVAVYWGLGVSAGFRVSCPGAIMGTRID